MGRGGAAPGRVGERIPGKVQPDSHRQCRTAGAVEAATTEVRKPLPPGKFKSYLLDRLRLRHYFEQPGDGRPQPQIPARVLLWSFLIGTVLRRNSFHALEALAHSPARQSLKIPRKFGKDALGYWTERLATVPLRQAMVGGLRQAKRNKAFDIAFWIGLILDGTGAARSTRRGCRYCHPIQTQGDILGYNHKFSLDCLTAAGLVLPTDVEPYRMYPEVLWPVRQARAALVVPPTSIVTTTERTFVIRVKNDVVEWVSVARGAPVGDLLEVYGPLHEGDLIVRRGSDELREGTRAKVNVPTH